MRVASSAERWLFSTITRSAGRMPQPAISRYCPASADNRASCPASRKSGSASSSGPSETSPAAAESHSPMRATRRICTVSPCAAALATSGITAQAKPDPTRKSTRKSATASTEAASASTSYQPSISVSVRWMANWARWLPMSGSPRVRMARRWAPGLVSPVVVMAGAA